MNQEEERIAAITHIHEASVKSAEINNMLKDFYKKVRVVAELKGIKLSVLNPEPKEESLIEV